MLRNVLIALALASGVVPFASSVRAAPVILNEYNAVDDDLFLEQADASDVFWGRRPGNGNDWFELAVVSDHVDMRGWELHVSNSTAAAGQETFLLKLSTHAVWADIRRGTIITFSEELENNVAEYQPEAGRWWINVRAAPDTGGTYVTVSCVAPACSPSAVNWKVSNNNWQLTIKNSVGATLFGPAGEGVAPLSGVGSTEVCKLEDTPTVSTTPLSLYRDGTSSTFGQPNRYSAGTLAQDFDALRSVVPYAPLTDVRINEVSTHTDPGTDWVELRNMTDQAVDIGGWFLSDSFSLLSKYEFPPGTIVPAFGHLLVDEVTLGFAFSAPCGERAVLSQGNGVVVTGPRDFVEFGPAENGVTMGRYPDGVGALMRLKDATPGGDNAPPRQGPVVINEIMYHPVDPIAPSTLNAEFVELRNVTAVPVTLATDYGVDGVRPWKLTGGVDFSFSPSTTVPADGYLVVVSFDPVVDTARLSEFRAYYGMPLTVPVVGPYGGKLDNFSDLVRLRKPDQPEPNGDICGGSGNPSPYVPGVIVDEVRYFDFGDWPEEADGQGASLERIDAHAFGNDASNWTANVGHTATPGMPNSSHGPATYAQQKCINALNKSFAKVEKAAGGAAYACIRSTAGGRLPAGVDADACLTLDENGRIAGAALAAVKVEQQLCTGTSDLEPNGGFYGPRNAGVVNAAGTALAGSLLRDVFGDDLDASVVSSTTEPAVASCQAAVVRALLKCVETRVRAFNGCKKSSLREGLISESADLEGCVDADSSGKVDAACDATAGRIGAAIQTSCVAAGAALESALPGCEAASAPQAAACAERLAACRTCLALNAADSLAADCDISDNGTEDNSCP